jgi:hypothetical protein
MKTRSEKILNQIALQEKVVADAGVNIVTCGQCGSLMLHEVRPLESDQELECPFCDFESDPCDFPDYFYEGFELSAVHNPTAEEFLREKLALIKTTFPSINFRVEWRSTISTWLVETTPQPIFEDLEYVLAEMDLQDEFEALYGKQLEILFVSEGSLNEIRNVTFEV